MKKALTAVIVICIAVTTLFGFSSSAQAATGGWTEISTAKELYNCISKNPNGKIRLMSDITFKKSDFYSSGEFPDYFTFGNNVSYKGVFDGCGHTVSNAIIVNSITGSNYGTIKNITFKDCSFYDYYSSSYTRYCEILSSYNYGTISNVRAIGCTASGFALENKFGGLIQYCSLDYKSAQGTYNYIISNNYGTVNGFVNYAVNNEGIVTRNQAESGKEAPVIKNCINYGSGLKAGICCSNYGTVSCCANYGAINNPGNAVAGIVQSGSGLVINCINYGNISGSTVSGIASYADYCVNLGTLNASRTKYNIGYRDVNACYYLGTSDGTSSGTEIDSSEVGLESSYPELDFKNTWEIKNNKPVLKMDKEKLIAITAYGYPQKTAYYQYSSLDFSDLLLMTCNKYGYWKLSDDYTLVGNTNTIGNGSITVKHKGLSVSIPIVIYGQINKGSLRIITKQYVYNGKARKPSVIVKDRDGNILSPSSDYTVQYKNNVNAGVATIIVKGKGFYKGEIKGTFKITPCPLKSKEVKLKKTSFVFDGKAKKPAANVKGNGKTLVKNKDYKITYSNNTNPPGGVAVIKGIGNYKGSFKRTFKIYVGKTKGLKAAQVYPTSVQLKWKKYKGVTGYQIQKYDVSHKKWSTYKLLTKNTNSFTVDKLAQGKEYKFRVRAYKKVGKKRYFGGFSNTVSAKTAPYQVTGLKNVYCENVYGMVYGNEIVWNPQKGVTGYQIKFSTGSTETVKGWSNTNYYYEVNIMHIPEDAKVCVRSYKTINGKTYYGNWSSKIYM